MSYLMLGLVLFLGVHSVRIVADGWRTAQLARLGEARWKMRYALASALGLALVVWGYGLAREAAMPLWSPPPWTRHLAALLILPAFVLVVAAYVRGNRLQAAVGHPMVAGVALWALAHLLSNGNLADVVLFGSFALWAGLSWRAARARDRAAGVVRTPGPLSRDLATLAIGLLAWAGFALVLHAPLIGVSPW